MSTILSKKDWVCTESTSLLAQPRAGDVHFSTTCKRTHTHTTNALVLFYMQSSQQARPRRVLGSVSPRTSWPASPWPVLHSSSSRLGLAMASARRDTKALVLRISPLMLETASNAYVVLPSYRRHPFTFTGKMCCTV